eukprot:COSAG01_NODE_1926_length_8882_cov_24.713651_2_plen_87_part_00
MRAMSGSRCLRPSVWLEGDCAALVPVAGGMLILGGNATDESAAEAELFDEESRRWLKLPHGMGTWFAAVVSVPAVALCQAPATSSH